VSGSHLGMLVNKDVYRAIAEALALPSEGKEALAGKAASARAA